MSKSSREGWTWEKRVCEFCGERVLKSQSFGCSYDFEQTWHTDCASGPKQASRRRLTERQIFRGHGVNV